MRIRRGVAVAAAAALMACGGGGTGEEQRAGTNQEPDGHGAAAGPNEEPVAVGGGTPATRGTPGLAPGAPGEQGPGGTAPSDLPAGVTPAMVTAGSQVFTGQGLCYVCHGQDGGGTATAPSLRDGEWLWANPDDLYPSLVQVITNGVPQPKEYPAAMPPRGGAALTDEQVRAVAAYVLTLSSAGTG